MNNPQVNSTSSHDPVGTYILNIEIILVLNQFEESIYLFKNNWNQYWKYILKLNPEKASIFGNITTQVLKESFDAFNLALKNIWNLEMLEKHCFSLHLTSNVNKPMYGASSKFILLIVYLIWNPLNPFYILKIDRRTSNSWYL